MHSIASIKSFESTRTFHTYQDQVLMLVKLRFKSLCFFRWYKLTIINLLRSYSKSRCLKKLFTIHEIKFILGPHCVAIYGRKGMQ